ncbi:anaphase promoting complex subunit 5, partial [Podila epigama]
DASEYLQNDLVALGNQVVNEVGQPCLDHLQTILKRIKSPHHLSDFFVSKMEKEDSNASESETRAVGLAGLVVANTNPMDPASILGLYVRKAQIEFKKLLFEGTCQLFSAIETYKNSPQTTGERLVVQSVYDAEKYLDQQTQHLSNPSLPNIPDEVLEHVKSIQHRMPTVAKSHYVICLQAQQMGDFEMAIESLHRLFDYCMAMHDQELYQYALLNLAILHARFGHLDQARLAIRETIEVARDNMDQECLSYALSWGDRLSGTDPASNADMNEARSMASGPGKTESQSFHYLQSLGELLKARQQQGESVSSTLESLIKSSSINLRHSLEGVGGVIQLFQSKTWEAYGNAPLSSLYSQMQIQFRPSESDMNDASSSLSKFASDLALNGNYEEALCVLEEAKSRFPLKTMRATPWVHTLLQILQRKALDTNHLRDAEVWTAQLGSTLVTPAIPTSLNNKRRFVDRTGPEQEATQESTGSVAKRGRRERRNTKSKQEKPLSKEQEFEDEHEASPQATRLDDTTLEVQLDTILQIALLNVLSGQKLLGVEQLSDGLDLVQQSQWPCSQKFTVIYLLALAELYMDSDSAISALPLLLVATMLSNDNFQRPLQFVVKLRMADILLHLDSVAQASDLVDSVMPHVLNQGDMFVQALAYFQKAKCLLSRVNQFAQRSQNAEFDETWQPRLEQTKQSNLMLVYELLQRALQGFQKIKSLKDVAQVLYFQVRILHDLGHAEALSATLAAFKTVSQQLTEGSTRQEPSWYSYYYTHDTFDGLLRPTEHEGVDLVGT